VERAGGWAQLAMMDPLRKTFRCKNPSLTLSAPKTIGPQWRGRGGQHEQMPENPAIVSGRDTDLEAQDIISRCCNGPYRPLEENHHQLS